MVVSTRLTFVNSGPFGLIGVVIGELITCLVSSNGDRRRRPLVERDHRLTSAQEVLGALQELNRRIIDAARVDSADHNDRDSHELHLATTRWNTGRHAAALIEPEGQIDLLQEIEIAAGAKPRRSWAQGAGADMIIAITGFCATE